MNTDIAVNRKALHDYFVEDRFEAGLVLEGWEVKGLRAGRLQLRESYVLIKRGEAWLLGSHISPLPSASTHVTPDPDRSRKLLLHEKEISKLAEAIQRKGYTVIPLSVYWKRGMAKCAIALAKGKQVHDKRETEKKREWDRERLRILKSR